jgi:hypothetical protein
VGYGLSRPIVLPRADDRFERDSKVVGRSVRKVEVAPLAPAVVKRY